MRREQMLSAGSVIAMILVLPLLLKGVSYVSRFLVGAEGRLAAITVETDHVLGPMPAPWRALAQGGDELTTFLDNTSGQVAGIKTAYIRIDHLYDGFDVVSRDGNGLQFNWTKLDTLIEKMRAAGVIPF